MIPSDALLLKWLRERTTQCDRVLADALNQGHVESIKQLDGGWEDGWKVCLQSKRGVEYTVIVVAHPVTGEPVRYHRV